MAGLTKAQLAEKKEQEAQVETVKTRSDFKTWEAYNKYTGSKA